MPRIFWVMLQIWASAHAASDGSQGGDECKWTNHPSYAIVGAGALPIFND